MKAHPIIDYPYRWVPMLVVALVLVVAQVMIMSVYTGADYVPAVIDGIATIGWLMALGYLAWFVVGVVSIFQTEVITLVAGILIWIAGNFMVYDIVTRIAGMPYITFASTIPFRLLFGIPTCDGPERCRALPAKLVYALQRAARAGNHAAGIISENHHPAPAFL